jgi:serine/threonine protein kinase/tetratricopeptide (TPR) repeat protein
VRSALPIPDPDAGGLVVTATTSIVTGHATSPSDSPWRSSDAGDGATPLPPAPPPSTIGPYTILELLGEGGMGMVYRAQQTEPLRRDVAIKIVKRGIDTDRVVGRFTRERRALARLDHPNIARVLDAGATPDGRPYFVMELVAGRRVTAFCDAERLGVEARLAIFLDICQAVRHAHQRGVLHRDLKPSNVLVGVVDGRPMVKVIDFGIAKVMDDTEDQPALDTRLSGQAVGTPAYMSPEQAGLLDTGIDTRTDVYSLGVLLYELLTGHHPRDFAPHAPSPDTTVDRRPSAAVLRTLTGPRGIVDAAALAGRRQTTPQRLRRQLSGDLDTVMLKAIEREPDRRYDSVEQFADDVRRVIAGEPVKAKPPTWSYRTRRFVRRHRVAVAAAARVGLGIAGAAALLVRQSVVIARERDRAREAERRASLDAATANQVTDFLSGLFEVAGPDRGGTKEVTAREMLDEGARRVRDGLGESPIVKARLLRAMGGAYMDMHQHARAEALLKEALEVRRHAGDAPDRDVFRTLQHLTRLRTYEGDMTGALAYSDQSRVIAERLEPVPGPYHADYLNTLGMLQTQAGQYEDARRTFEQALPLAVAAGALATDDPQPREGRVLHNLGGVLYELGRLEEAQARFAQAAAYFSRYASGSREQASYEVGARSAQGLVLRDLKRLDEARRALDEGVVLARQIYREPHPALATILNNLALAEQDQKDYAQADTHFREVLAIDRAVNGEKHADVAADLHNLGWFLYRYRGQADEGERLARQAVTLRTEVLGPRHPQTASSMRSLADILNGRGRPAEALPLYRQAYAIQSEVLPKGHRLTLSAALGLGEALTALGRRAEAASVLDGAIRVARGAAPNAPQLAPLEAALAKASAAAPAH